MIIVKNILLVGKFNDILNNDFFNELFNVQICVDSIPMVKGMLKIENPDLVMISFCGISSDAKEIFGELKSNYYDTPVICIGTEEEVKAHINSISTSQFIILNTPVDKDTILDRICKALNVTCIDNIIVDNKAGKKSILLVDDSKIQLRALNEMLKEKYEVRVATSGMQALTLIGKKKPDLIFLDYEMPICDGKMTLEMIRELDESKDIPVVFLTGVSDKEHIAAVLDLKPEGYLLKPANSDVIYKTIEKVFGEINNDI